jgi:hypothetical protein
MAPDGLLSWLFASLFLALASPIENAGRDEPQLFSSVSNAAVLGCVVHPTHRVCATLGGEYRDENDSRGTVVCMRENHTLGTLSCNMCAPHMSWTPGQTRVDVAAEAVWARTDRNGVLLATGARVDAATADAIAAADCSLMTLYTQFEYLRQSLASVLLLEHMRSKAFAVHGVARPRLRVLMLGLGGGSAPSFLHRVLGSSVDIDVVEVDPTVVWLAVSFLGFRVASNLRVVIDDALHYLNRTDTVYDWIFNDISTPDESLPVAAFVTPRALRLMAARLHPLTGVLSLHCWPERIDNALHALSALEPPLFRTILQSDASRPGITHALRGDFDLADANAALSEAAAWATIEQVRVVNMLEVRKLRIRQMRHGRCYARPHVPLSGVYT